MRLFTLCAAMVFIASAGFAFELQIEATLPDGTPAVGVRIEELTLDAPAARRMVGDTDRWGRLTVHVEERPTFDDGRGINVVRYIAQASGYAPAYSDLYVWSHQARFGARSFPGDLNFYREKQADVNSNWRSGAIVETHPNRTYTWHLTLDEGFDAPVVLTDLQGQPIANARVELHVNVEMLPEIGPGGDTQTTALTTDAEGRFVLPHAGDHIYTLIAPLPYVDPRAPYPAAVREVRFHASPTPQVIRLERR